MNICTPILDPQTGGRTQDLAWNVIEALLGEMKRGLEDPSYLEKPSSEKYFGHKQSMVVNLHRLVATIVALRALTTKTENAVPEIAAGLSHEEMLMLRDLLGEANEPNAMEAIQEMPTGSSGTSFPDSAHF